MPSERDTALLWITKRLEGVSENQILGIPFDDYNGFGEDVGAYEGQAAFISSKQKVVEHIEIARVTVSRGIPYWKIDKLPIELPCLLSSNINDVFILKTKIQIEPTPEAREIFKFNEMVGSFAVSAGNWKGILERTGPNYFSLSVFSNDPAVRIDEHEIPILPGYGNQKLGRIKQI